MKKFFSLVALIAILSFVSTEKANAGIPVTFGSHEKITKIYDLPDTDDYKSDDGQYIDLGYKYTVYEITFLPIFQQGEGKIVGFKGDMYYDLSKEELANIAKENKIEDIDALAKLSFWDAWGGKLVVLLVVILIIFAITRDQKKD